jgi:hypothetical protein
LDLESARLQFLAHEQLGANHAANEEEANLVDKVLLDLRCALAIWGAPLWVLSVARTNAKCALLLRQHNIKAR